ncbi:olfactory receptor 5AP2-like [Lissotriton helveticus]
MKERNWTSVKEFILLGVTDEPKLQIPLFIMFLLFYIITLLGNISIVALVTICPHLHTPMYFLLSNLAFVDFSYSSVITPKMLINLISETKAISLHGCMTQLFFFSFMGSTDIFLLAAMAYDRYVAICNPLLYVDIMTKGTCLCLSGGAYSVAFMNALIHTSCMSRLSFCGPNKITHFYCDVPPLLKLSCSDTLINVTVVVSMAGSILGSSFIIICVSYIYIISAIFRINSFEGRSRAFSTCSSHFFSVVLFYGTLSFMYLRPSSIYSMDQDRVASVFYTVVIPMLNPLIYTLRNQEVIRALRKFIWQHIVLYSKHLIWLLMTLFLNKPTLESSELPATSAAAHDKPDIHGNTSTDTLSNKIKALEKKSHQEQSKWWEARSLQKYAEVNRIPRGLRILTSPTYENPNPELMREWADNNLEASRRSVLIFIKYAEIDRAKLLDEIAIMDEELDALGDSEEKTKLLTEMSTRLKKEEEKIIARKT